MPSSSRVACQAWWRRCGPIGYSQASPRCCNGRSTGVTPENTMHAQVPSRVVCRRLDWDLNAADVLRLLRADPHPVALLGAWAGGSDILAACPVRTGEELDATN